MLQHFLVLHAVTATSLSAYFGVRYVSEASIPWRFNMFRAVTSLCAPPIGWVDATRRSLAFTVLLPVYSRGQYTACSSNSSAFSDFPVR